jgi:YVTN family beta-propeller protein
MRAPLAALAIALLLALPLGINALSTAPPATRGLAAAPRGPDASTVRGPDPRSAPSAEPAPSGVGPGNNSILATLDLVHGTLVPGIDNDTMNSVAPLVAAFDPEKQVLYVASLALNAVQVVNITSHQVVGLISVPGGPRALVYDPAGHEIYVADVNSNNLSVINDTTNTVVGTIPVPSGNASIESAPVTLAYDPLNQTVLVGQYGGPLCCTDNITVVDGVTNRIVGEIPAPADVIAIAYNPSDNLLYALGSVGPTIGITSLVTGASVANWTPTVPAGTYTGITIDPQTGLLYLTSTDFGTRLNVTQISAATGVVDRNTSILEPGAAFGLVSPVYSNATGMLYVSGYTGELYTLSGGSGALVGGALDGVCVGPVVLTASGAPLVAPDTCGGVLLWLDGKTAVESSTSVTGAAPSSVQQIPSTGDVAVLEAGTQRLDLLNPSTGTVSEQISLGAYGSAPAASTVDNSTGWLYFYNYVNAAELTTGPLVAYDTSAQAVIWTFPVCPGCLFDGLGDAYGEIYLDVINTSAQAVDLFTLNATSGHFAGEFQVAGYSYWADSALPQMDVAPMVGSVNESLVVLGDLPLETTFAYNLSAGAVAWTYPTGSATGSLAFLAASGLLAVGTTNTYSGLYSVDFLNVTNGLSMQSVTIENVPLSLVPGAAGTEAFVLEGGFVLTLWPNSTLPLANLTVPADGGYTGLFSLGESGGIALPSPTFGTVFWIGATFNISDFSAVGPTVQGESLTLSANVTGGYGSETFVYTGLPAGCVSADAATLTCLPLTAGEVAVSLRANDSTGLSAVVAKLDLTLAAYPLTVNLSSATTYFLAGSSATFVAQLPASEAAIAPALNYSWSLQPAAAGTLNRTNASTVTVTWVTTGAVALVLTVDLRGTDAKTQLNLSVLSSTTTNSVLGVSGAEELLLLGLVVVIVVVGVAVFVVRSRRNAAAPPEETTPPEESPEPESGSVPP